MIRSYADRETRKIAGGDVSRKLPTNIQQRAFARLQQIDAASDLSDLGNIPGNRLHALKEDRAGQHAISINDQWRICFVWRGGGADDVEITDYH